MGDYPCERCLTGQGAGPAHKRGMVAKRTGNCRLRLCWPTYRWSSTVTVHVAQSGGQCNPLIQV